MSNHHWGPTRRVLPDESPDGCERSEHACRICALVKITVHPPQGFPFRKWRHRSGVETLFDHTPPCPGSVIAPD